MKQLNKGMVVFKHKSEDFIVEEINIEGKICSVSKSVGEFKDAKVDFTGLDLKERRDFIMFDFEKINIDHFSAISILCKELGKRAHEIGYAGTKDKAAWTAQRISVFNPNMEKMKNFSYPGIILKNFRWGKHKIKIGDLKGNKFSVILRDVDREAIKILSRVRNTKNIPNFFGLQRFGSLRKDNFNIGKLILKKKYKEAIFAYLTGYGSDESKEVKEAKKRLKEEKDLASASKYFPKELRTEHKIIEYLSKNKNDFTHALELIGEKTLLIMVQSVQSRIFNDILENLIEKGAITEEDKLVIPGYDFNDEHIKFKRTTEDIIKEYELEIEDFRNEDFPFLNLTTLKRHAFFKVKEVVIDTSEDELFIPAKKIKIQFACDSGSYASTFLEYFFELR